MKTILDKTTAILAGLAAFLVTCAIAGLGLALIAFLAVFALAAIGLAILAAPFAGSTRQNAGVK